MGIQAAAIADSINRRLERLMPFVAPAGVTLGFLLPGVFIHLRPFVVWIFSLITFSGALKLRVGDFGRTLRRPLPIALAFFSNHVIMPLLALFFANIFFRGNTDTVTGFVLLYCAPVAVSAFIWVNIYGGDNALGLTVILLDTLLSPLVMPATILLLVGTKTAIDMTGIIVSLFFMVVAPTIIGVTANELSRGSIPKAVCPWLNPLSKIGLVLVIAANTSPIAPQVRFSDPMVWKVLALCITLVATGFVVAKLTAAAGRFDSEKQVSLFFTGGLRNISAVTTIAVTYFPVTAVLPTLLGIVCQQSIAALMSKIMIRKKQEQ